MTDYQMPSPYRDIEDDTRYLMAEPELTSIDKPDLTSEIGEILHRLNGHKTEIERVEFIMGKKFFFNVGTNTIVFAHRGPRIGILAA